MRRLKRPVCLLMAVLFALAFFVYAPAPRAAAVTVSSRDAFIGELERSVLALPVGRSRVVITYAGLPRLSATEYYGAMAEVMRRNPALMYALESWSAAEEGYPQTVMYTVTLKQKPAAPVFSVDTLDMVGRAINTLMTCRLSSVIVYVRDIDGKYSNTSTDSYLIKVFDRYYESSGDDYNMYITRKHPAKLIRPPFEGVHYSGFFLQLSAEYRETLRQSARAYSAASAIIAQIPADISDAEKVAMVNTLVCDAATYAADDTPRSVYTAFGALINGQAVCQGYMLSVHLILSRMGLSTRCVEGYADGVAHAWNLVRIDGEWRHIDTTWNDQVGEAGGDGTMFMLRDDMYMSQERHSWNQPAYTPSLNADWQRARNTLHSHEMSFVIGKPNFLLDGMDVAIDRNAPALAPVLHEGRTMLPARALAEYMGGIVEWAASQQKVTITYRGRVVEMFVGNTRAYINGADYKMDVAPQLIGGFTMVPLRFVAEALGCTVGWNGDTSTATVKYRSY